MNASCAGCRALTRADARLHDLHHGLAPRTALAACTDARDCGGCSCVGPTGVQLQVADLHGDIIGTVTKTETDWLAGVEDGGTATVSTTSEYGEPVTGSRYDYLGTHQRQRDTTSGLQLMGARLYNPTTGRFLQTDPVVGGSANNYDYAAADVPNSVDLDGMATKSFPCWITEPQWSVFRSSYRTSTGKRIQAVVDMICDRALNQEGALSVQIEISRRCWFIFVPYPCWKSKGAGEYKTFKLYPGSKDNSWLTTRDTAECESGSHGYRARIAAYAQSWAGRVYRDTHYSLSYRAVC